MPIRSKIVFRLGIVYFAVLIFSLLIIGKIIYIQVYEKDEWMQESQKLTHKDIIIKPNRGDICASDGRLMASSLPYYEVRMDLLANGLTDKRFYDNIDSLSKCLAGFFKDKSAYQYKKELIETRENSKYRRNYLVNKRMISYSELLVLKKFPLFCLNKNKGGFIPKQINTRKKPFNSLASRTIGRIKNKGESRTIIGIEGAYNTYLNGSEGIRLMKQVSGSSWIPLNEGNELEPQDGKDVITTINIEFQDITENALRQQLKSHNANFGVAVVMEVNTGEVKAIANLEKSKDENEYIEIFNHAIGTSSEPGSTFKLASMIVALEDGAVNLSDKVKTYNGIFHYKGFEIRDAHRGGYGTISVQRAFELSSNVGIAKIIIKNYHKNPRKFIDRLYRMRLNEKLGIEFYGEGKPFIKYPGDEHWSDISIPQIAIGYETHLTPLQILTFYNAVANNGVMVKPKFVKRVEFHGQTIKTVDTEILNPSICSMGTIRKVKNMLEGVVERGTAANIRTTRYKIAGKTGTAKIYDEEKRGYVKKYQASFVGYFPADKPKYSCIVVINTPTEMGYYGSYAAAPVFKKIADKIYNIDINLHKEDGVKLAKNKTIQIPSSKDGLKNDFETIYNQLGIKTSGSRSVKSKWIVTTEGTKSVKMENRLVKTNIVPKVEGMGARDALYILENAGMNVVLKGRGTVIRQSIQAGSLFKKGEKIILELS